MRRRIVILMMMVLFSSFVFAQNESKAEKILSAVSKEYKSYSSFRIRFSLTVDNKEENIHDSSLGIADIKNDKYKITIMGADTYFDGKTRYTYLKDSEEVNISEPEEEDSELSNPAKIFDLYKDGYVCSVAKEYKLKGENIVEVILTPEEEKEYSKVLIVINTNKNRIVSFTSFGNDGNNLVLEMKKLESNHSFNDAYFVFDVTKNPNVEVIDMR